MESTAEVHSLEQLLDAAGERHLSDHELAEVKRILYGNPSKYAWLYFREGILHTNFGAFPCYRRLEIPAKASSLAKDKNFEVKAYMLGAAKEQGRLPRLVRVALVQNAIVSPTTDPVKDQVSTDYSMAMKSMLQCLIRGSNLVKSSLDTNLVYIFICVYSF